jgi:hypothetical protein
MCSGLSGEPLTVSPANPGGSPSAPEKPESDEFAEANFSAHTRLSDAHRIVTVHSPVRR